MTAAQKDTSGSLNGEKGTPIKVPRYCKRKTSGNEKPCIKNQIKETHAIGKLKNKATSQSRGFKNVLGKGQKLFLEHVRKCSALVRVQISPN